MRKTQKKYCICLRFIPVVFFMFLMTPIVSSAADEWLYTVKQGDTLWSISGKWLNNAADWEKLQVLNDIKDPRKLVPDSFIKIPNILLKRDDNSVIVDHLQGEVTISDSLGNKLEQSVGMHLSVGDQIETEVGENIGIQFKDGSTSLLQESSGIRIERVEIVDDKRDVKIHLQRGQIDSEIKSKKNVKSRFEITTPSAVASVRGTSFRVANNPLTQQFRTEVLDGKVAVESEGVMQLVEEGFGTVVKEGEPPAPPTKLLPQVNLSHLPTLFVQTPIYFSFPTVDEAVGYRVEIREGDDTAHQIKAGDIVEPSFHAGSLANGDFVVRVYAYDVNGLGGEVTEHKLSVKVKPKVQPPALPQLILPDHQRLLQKTEFSFRWSESANANGYRFQLAADKGFTRLIADIYPYYFTQLSISDRLASGEYFWHVAALDQNHHAFSFTNARSFRIPPDSPTLALAHYDDEHLLLSWSKVKDNINYRVQIASDRKFTQMLVNEQVNTVNYRLALEEPGEYFARVMSVEEDGYMSDSSNIRHMRIYKSGFFSRSLENIDSATEFSEF